MCALRSTTPRSPSAFTDAGPAVEAVTQLRMPAAGANLESFRVGRVVSAEQHPDADRLRVCQVDLGEPELRQIVCGAPNVGAGQTVAVALPGAVLPERPPLGEVTLRGVRSRGMILSESELQLAADSEGIMVLPDDIPAGTPVAEVLPISDTVFELELTSNRPDLMGIYGIAREVHAITGAPLGGPRRLRGAGHRPGQRRGLREPAGRGAGALPALHGPGRDRRARRAVAGVAAGATRGRRDALDQQRGRHHQLRDAPDRTAAARLRSRPHAGAGGRRPPRPRR